MSFLQPWAFLLLGLSVAAPPPVFPQGAAPAAARLLSPPVVARVPRPAGVGALPAPPARPLLLLQLLALLLLCAALAPPDLTLQGKGAERLIFVVDSSASMKARDVGSSRIREAQQQAAGLIAEAGQGAELMVIEAGSQPTIRLNFTAGPRPGSAGHLRHRSA